MWLLVSLVLSLVYIKVCILTGVQPIESTMVEIKKILEEIFTRKTLWKFELDSGSNSSVCQTTVDLVIASEAAAGLWLKLLLLTIII